ncbi:MAG: host attachment protein [Mariprofundaceae bacterium]
METTWILVANSSEARLFSLGSDGMQRISEFAHPQSREKGQALTSDRPGHYQSSNIGTAHGAYAESTDPREYESEQFARELADKLEHGRATNQFGRLLLAAPPHFHGMLNKHINGHLSKLVSGHVEKDYTKVADDELMEYLQSQVHISRL